MPKVIPRLREQSWLIKELTAPSANLWLSGAHGVGKTTLVEEAVAALPAHLDVRFVDCREEVHCYPSLQASLLHKLGLTQLGDSWEDSKQILASASSSDNQNIRFIFDELDVYQPEEILHVNHLLNSRHSKVGCLFISARSMDYFNQYDDGSIKPAWEWRLTPLSYLDTVVYLRSRGISSSATEEIAVVSGGNPTLLGIALNMYSATRNTDPFAAENAQFRLQMYSYCKKLWSGLEDYQKTYAITGAVLSIHMSSAEQNRLPEIDDSIDRIFSELAHYTHGMFAFNEHVDGMYVERCGSLPPIVSPVFSTWAIIENLSYIKPECIVVPKEFPVTAERSGGAILGVPVSTWQTTGSALSGAKNGASLFQTLVETITGIL